MSAFLITALLITLPPPLCRGRESTGYDPRRDQDASERATAEVRAAYEALCPNNNCGSGVIYKNETIGMNAVTWVSGIRDGQATKAKIVYSPAFLDGLARQFGDGASFGVLAHEVGHHLTAALGKRGEFDHSWDEELRADYLAGCALARAARPPSELEAALRALAATASPTHPAFDKRNPVIRKGYDDCKKHQDKFDSLPDQNRFGIGAVLKSDEQPAGCWKYFYRAQEEIEQVGPIAAKRRRSSAFASRSECEAARQTTVQNKSRLAEPCVCN